jgi:hypothetical protein
MQDWLPRLTLKDQSDLPARPLALLHAVIGAQNPLTTDQRGSRNKAPQFLCSPYLLILSTTSQTSLQKQSLPCVSIGLGKKQSADPTSRPCFFLAFAGGRRAWCSRCWSDTPSDGQLIAGMVPCCSGTRVRDGSSIHIRMRMLNTAGPWALQRCPGAKLVIARNIRAACVHVIKED